jgi:hypothetical protein
MEEDQLSVHVFILFPLGKPARWIASKLGASGAFIATVMNAHGEGGKNALKLLSETGYFLIAPIRFYSICSGCFLVGSLISFLLIPGNKPRNGAEALRLHSAITNSSLTGRDSSEILLESFINYGMSPDVANMISWLVVNSKSLAFIIPIVKLFALFGTIYCVTRWLLYFSAQNKANDRNYYSKNDSSQDELKFFSNPYPNSRFLR